MRLPTNDEGVDPPLDPNMPSPARAAKRGREIQSEIGRERGLVARVLNVEIAMRHQIICAAAASDEHWLETTRAWAEEAPDVPINPRKRVLTCAKLLYGPDRLADVDPAVVDEADCANGAVHHSNSKRKKVARKTYGLAHRRSYVHLALIWRGVPVDPKAVAEYLARVANPEMLIAETKQWVKAGCPAPLPANITTGMTSSGMPLRVRLKGKAGAAVEEAPDGPMRLRGTKLTSPVGDMFIDIDDFNDDEQSSGPRPDVPSGMKMARLLALPELLERLLHAGDEPVLVRLHAEATEMGPDTLTLVDVLDPPRTATEDVAAVRSPPSELPQHPAPTSSSKAGRVLPSLRESASKQTPAKPIPRPPMRPRLRGVGEEGHAKPGIAIAPKPINRPAMKPRKVRQIAEQPSAAKLLMKPRVGPFTVRPFKKR